MWDLALITIFINHPLYVSYSFSQYGTGVLHLHIVKYHGLFLVSNEFLFLVLQR
jgi:hypothetical protein